MNTVFKSVISTVSDDLKIQNSNHKPTNFAFLKIYVEDNLLRSKYANQIEKHNKTLFENQYPDAGFDILVPEDVTFNTNITTQFIDSGIKTEMYYYNADDNTTINTGYSVHPRSSISKTPLMLANHTGIIDSGYRGNLIGAFRWFQTNEPNYTVKQYTRLTQVCHPSLCPIYVMLVEQYDLTDTSRNEGGFGSTGL